MKTYTQVNEWLETEDDVKVYDNVVKQLKEIQIDGESMERLIDDVGMTDQMIRQLIGSNPEKAFTELLDLYKDISDSEELNEYLLNKITNDKDFYKKITDMIIQADSKKYNL